jgi:chromosome partitioning protein
MSISRIITFANQKGGVGKTTTVVNVAAGLAQLGHTVLVIDMDPQANATYALVGAVELQHTTYDLLTTSVPLTDLSIKTPTAGIYLVPSDIDLAGAEIELIQEIGGQLRLRSKMQKLVWDYVLVDAPPSLGMLTVNALAACQQVIIPVNCGVFALKGIARLEETIDKVRNNLGVELRISGIICTLFDHTNVARDVVNAVRERFGTLAFDTMIPKNVKIEEAHSRAKSVLDWAPDSTGAIAYRQLVEEILNRE